MGRLIVVEGLDGAGKQTLVRALAAEAEAAGIRVATLAFPRYGASVYADLVRDALYGRLGDLSASVYGTALLFALDRRDAKAGIEDLTGSHDVVILDRYVSSNAAYGTARLAAAPAGPHADDGHASDGGQASDDRHASGQASFASWVYELEIVRFGLPVPDRHVLLTTPPALAAARARGRAAEQTDRALDRFEADAALQERTADAYRALAAQSFLSPWLVVEPGVDGHAVVPLDTLLADS